MKLCQLSVDKTNPPRSQQWAWAEEEGVVETTEAVEVAEEDLVAEEVPDSQEIQVPRSRVPETTPGVRVRVVPAPRDTPPCPQRAAVTATINMAIKLGSV